MLEIKRHDNFETDLSFGVYCCNLYNFVNAFLFFSIENVKTLDKMHVHSQLGLY